MITRLTEMRNNVEMERAERRQRSYEDAMGIVHAPGQAKPLPPPEPFVSGGYDCARMDREHEAARLKRIESENRGWAEYLRTRDPNAHCACGRFKVACMFTERGFHRTKTIPRVIIMDEPVCRRCPNPVKHEGDLCGVCQQEQAEVMADLHKER